MRAVWDDVPMSSTSPRHLPPRASSGPLTGALFGQAARLRAVVNADLLPRERAAADALVLTAWLSAAQRERYAPSLRAPGSVEEFAERLADERRVVLEEGADPVADEVGAAAEAERGARQIPLRLLEGALLLGALVCVVLTVLRSLDAADLPGHLAAEAGPLSAEAVRSSARPRRRPGRCCWAASRSAGACAAQAAAGRRPAGRWSRIPGPGALARRGRRDAGAGRRAAPFGAARRDRRDRAGPWRC